MRIGVNTLPLFPGQIGGMETYTVNLLTHLTAIDRQHTYYLFVARYNRDLFNAQLPSPERRHGTDLECAGLLEEATPV